MKTHVLSLDNLQTNVFKRIEVLVYRADVFKRPEIESCRQKRMKKHIHEYDNW